ncbi:MAG: DNA polymerase III subunit chi [Oceanospirillaceae bacterium]
MRADFYQLNSADPASRYPVLCRLLEKAEAASQAVYILCQDEAEVAHLDQYLWAFKPDAFIAHACADQTIDSSIILGHPDSVVVPKHKDICINLCSDLAPKEYERIIELVTQEHTMLITTREHFRAYQESGRTMQYHKL